MSILFDVVFAWKCSSTHHKLALDALRQLRGPNAEAWGNVFLYHVDAYLTGAKAPDDTFKDFRNHVLHVRENYWGGAVTAAQDWYGRTVTALREERWSDAIYAAGVLSHYVTDPLMPFHTGQTEEEGIVHRALEWSVAKSYEDLRSLLERRGGWPEVEVPPGDDWLAQLVRRGAESSNKHYEALIDHYDLPRGVKDPPAGLDEECRQRLAPLIGQAAVSFARVLQRAIAEASASPPLVNLTLAGILTRVTIPIAWITRKLKDTQDRALVEAMYREFQQTGKVVQTLPEDDRTVRRLHAEEVLKVPLATLDAQRPRKVGMQSGKTLPRSPAAAVIRKDPPAPLPPPISRGRRYLSPEQPVEAAPSIGKKTAERLDAVGVRTVADLLRANAEEVANRLATRGVSATTIAEWQAQAALVCDVHGLRGHDAQILVACGIRTTEELARARPADVWPKVQQFVSSAAGKRVLRSGKEPDLAEVESWIAAASLPQATEASR